MCIYRNFESIKTSKMYRKMSTQVLRERNNHIVILEKIYSTRIFPLNLTRAEENEMEHANWAMKHMHTDTHIDFIFYSHIPFGVKNKRRNFLTITKRSVNR